MKTKLLIDGENFKAKIKGIFSENNKESPVWGQYDFEGLFDKVLEGFEIDEIIFYFAKISRHEKTPQKSEKLIQEQRSMKLHLEKQGFKFVSGGNVRGHMEIGINKKETLVFKEKGVDVKIAVDMVSWSCDKEVIKIILGSSDSDLIPAIHEVRKREVECIYLGFEDKINKGILYSCNKAILIRNTEVLNCVKQEELPLK